MSYQPTGRVKEILDWSLNRIKSVPYKVTARWLFYRYVEEILKPQGMAVKDAKKMYKLYLQWTARARKRFYEGWQPDTLADDTRKPLLDGFGFEDPAAWLQHFKKEKCRLDKHLNQENVVEIWYEAQAMTSQFRFYVDPSCVSLRAFKGDASIDYKWRAAKHLEILALYEKPIVILYFGDYDEKGLQIPKSAVRDIRAWSKADFSFIRCGINKEHIVEWGIVPSWDREGTYQWEALDEDRAKALIIGNLEKYWSKEKVDQVKRREEKATKKWKWMLEEANKRLWFRVEDEGDESDG